MHKYRIWPSFMRYHLCLSSTFSKAHKSDAILSKILVKEYNVQSVKKNSIEEKIFVLIILSYK
jgi:hypothetical protein